VTGGKKRLIIFYIYIYIYIYINRSTRTCFVVIGSMGFFIGLGFSNLFYLSFGFIFLILFFNVMFLFKFTLQYFYLFFYFFNQFYLLMGSFYLILYFSATLIVNHLLYFLSYNKIKKINLTQCIP